jgi:hypothetical protein
MTGRLGPGLAFASILFASNVAFAQGETIVVQPPPAATEQQPPPPQQAPPPPPRPREKRPPEKEWYGWQTLGVDAGAFVLMAAGQATKTYSVFDVGFGAYLLGPPIVHIVHGNAGPAFGSVGLRLVSPWVGVAIGVTVGLFFLSSTAKDQTKCHGDRLFQSADCDYQTEPILLFKEEWARPLAYGFNVGLLAGYALALGVDAFLIAYEKIDDTEYGKAKPPVKGTTIFSMSPKLDIGQGRAGLGVGGTF